MDTIKLALVALGCLLAAIGAGLVYTPAGIILGGALLAFLGWFLEGDQ